MASNAPGDLEPTFARIDAAADHLSRLDNAGWRLQDSARSIGLSRDHSPPRDLASAIDPLLDLATDVEILSDTGFALALVGSALEVRQTPQAPEDHYSGADLEAALRARDGDSAAALALPGLWSARATVDLAAPLRSTQPPYSWRVVRDADVVADELAAHAWWDLASITRMSTGLPIFVVLSEHPIRVLSTSLAVVSRDEASGIDLPGADHKIDQLATMSRVSASSIPVPEELVPVLPVLGGHAAEARLRAAGAASALAWLASDVVVEDRVARLEFFGLRRVTCLIGPEGVLDPEHQRSLLALYEWATAEPSPDRFLAVRQVASVHEGDQLTAGGDDIRRAAEPVYRALRSDAVAEVFASQRQARQAGFDAARESADAVLAAAKAVGERTLAALAALGGLVIARATSTSVTPELIGQLGLGVALFTLSLAIWSVVIEGPTISLPVKTLDSDLKQVGDLLSDSERAAVLGMERVTRARKRALLVRVASPLAYLFVSLIALWVAHPEPDGFWDVIRAIVP